MFTIYVDGKKYQIRKSSNVLEACLSFGLDIPYFCWHPALGSVGSCRQCAIKQYEHSLDTNGRIVMSCMTPVVDGLILSIHDLEAQEFRKSVLELLMTYHPHDCPVCSEGGHCHLQDMTIMTGHHARCYRFKKRTHINQYLGPFILHEMNRCINCYRCIRYYKDYANGNDLGVYGVHNNLYFGRFQEGQLESEFSGNLIDVCPTGVFTDKTLSHNYARKWDMQFAPSVCIHCSVGCNIIFGERYGKICRVENRYHSNINGYFLCDRGRFGYDYVNNMENRYIRPLEKDNKNKWIDLNKEQVIQKAAYILKMSKTVVGIGSTRASIESNFALRDLVGPKNFYLGINRVEYRLLSLMLHVLKNSGIYISSLKEIENCDVILLLGEDVTQTNPRISLAIRQAIKGDITDLVKEKNIPIWHANAILSLRGHKRNNVLFITSIDKTKLDDVASWTYYASLNDQARFGFAVSHVLDDTAPKVVNFDTSLMSKVNMVAQTLLSARKPLIISGSSVGNEAIISSAVNIAKSLKNCGKDVSISFVASDSNSIGLAMIGGGSLDDICDLISEEDRTIDCMLVLETDLCRHISLDRVDSFLAKVKNLIVLDHQKFSFHLRSNLIFSSTSLPESDGTLINYEGRAQRFFRVYNPMYYDASLVILESWRWLYELYAVLHSDRKALNDKYINFDDVIDKVIESLPELFNIRLASPDASFRIRGQKLARAPHRYSGRTSMHAAKDVHEPRIFQDRDSMFTFSMEGNNIPNSTRQHVAFVWAPGWNSSQAWNKFQSEVRNDDILNSGIRCFESHNNINKNIDWFTNIPIVSISDKQVLHDCINKWYIVPYWHIFGSEELSQRSLAIQKCMLKPYVVFNRLDAIQNNLYDKKKLIFECGGQKLSLLLTFSDQLGSGYIGLPIGFPGISLSCFGMYIKDIEGIS